MDVSDIKFDNVKKIINTIRFGQSLTKKEIAYQTQLSFSTVSNVCNDLLEKGVLANQKSESLSVGRTPCQIIFCCHRFCSLCIDLKRKGLVGMAVLDFSNKVLFRSFYHVSFDTSLDQLVDRIYEIFLTVLEQNRLERERFIGAGVAVSGIFDRCTGNVVNSSIPLFEGQPLSALLGQRLGMRCYVDNEANLCAVAMAEGGEAEQTILYVHSDEGLGLGAVVNGQLLRGKNGYGGEVAHIPLGNPGQVCPQCGRRGCIEYDLIRDSMQPSGVEEDLFYQDRGRKLGRLLALLTNLFDPHTIYLGGAALDHYSKMERYVQEELNAVSPYHMERGLPVVHDQDSNATIYRGINQVVYERWNPLE